MGDSLFLANFSTFYNVNKASKIHYTEAEVVWVPKPALLRVYPPVKVP